MLAEFAHQRQVIDLHLPKQLKIKGKSCIDRQQEKKKNTFGLGALTIFQIKYCKYRHAKVCFPNTDNGIQQNILSAIKLKINTKMKSFIIYFPYIKDD